MNIQSSLRRSLDSYLPIARAAFLENTDEQKMLEGLLLAFAGRGWAKLGGNQDEEKWFATKRWRKERNRPPAPDEIIKVMAPVVDNFKAIEMTESLRLMMNEFDPDSQLPPSLLAPNESFFFYLLIQAGCGLAYTLARAQKGPIWVAKPVLVVKAMSWNDNPLQFRLDEKLSAAVQDLPELTVCKLRPDGQIPGILAVLLELELNGEAVPSLDRKQRLCWSATDKFSQARGASTDMTAEVRARALNRQKQTHRDCVMPLDETADGQHGSISLDEKARMIAFLVARNRPRKLSRTYEKNNALRKREFRVIVLSSSERALGEIARSAGKRRLAGEELRFLDVPASEPKSLGIIDGEIKSIRGKTPSETTKQIIDGLTGDAQKYQGHAKRAFLKKYVRDPDALAKAQRYKVEFENAVKILDDRKLYRIRSNFAAFYAGAALAIDYEILPWGKRAAFKAIKKCLRLALAQLEIGSNQAATPSQPADPKPLVDQLKRQLAQAAVVTVTPNCRADASEGQRRQRGDAFMVNGEVYVKRDRLRQWFSDDASRSTLIAKLKHINGLHWNREDTPTIEKKFAGVPGKPRYYVLDVKALGLSDKLRGQEPPGDSVGNGDR